MSTDRREVRGHRRAWSPRPATGWSTRSRRAVDERGRAHDRADRRRHRRRQLLKHVGEHGEQHRLVEGASVLGRRPLRPRGRRRAQREAGPRGAARPHRHPGRQRASDAGQRRRVRRRHRRRGGRLRARAWPPTPTTVSPRRTSTSTCSAWVAEGHINSLFPAHRRGARDEPAGARRDGLPQAAAAANHVDAARGSAFARGVAGGLGCGQGRRGGRRGRRRGPRRRARRRRGRPRGHGVAARRGGRRRASSSSSAVLGTARSNPAPSSRRTCVDVARIVASSALHAGQRVGDRGFRMWS